MGPQCFIHLVKVPICKAIETVVFTREDQQFAFWQACDVDPLYEFMKTIDP